MVVNVFHCQTLTNLQMAKKNKRNRLFDCFLCWLPGPMHTNTHLYFIPPIPFKPQAQRDKLAQGANMKHQSQSMFSAPINMATIWNVKKWSEREKWGKRVRRGEEWRCSDRKKKTKWVYRMTGECFNKWKNEEEMPLTYFSMWETNQRKVCTQLYLSCCA